MKLRNIISLAPAIAAAVIFGTASAFGGTYEVQHVNGGSLDRWDARYSGTIERGDRVEIQSDYCLSSCTLWLSHPNVCTARRTVYGFHGPSNGLLSNLSTAITMVPVYHFMPLKKRAYVIDLMAAHYNKHRPGLGDWFISSGASRKFGWVFTYVTAKELHAKFGVPYCNNKG